MARHKVRTYGNAGKTVPRECDRIETILVRLERSRYYSARVLRAEYQRYTAYRQGVVKLPPELVNEYKRWSVISRLETPMARKVLTLWVQRIENESNSMRRFVLIKKAV